MQGQGFVAFLFDTMLQEHFRSKTHMAEALGVQLRTLRRNFQNVEHAKGGRWAFEQLILYCCEKDISINEMYHRYLSENPVVESMILETGGEGMEAQGIMRWLFGYALEEIFGNDVRRMAFELRMGEDALKKALQYERQAESIVAFEALAKYCVKNDINIDSLLKHYPNDIHIT